MRHFIYRVLHTTPTEWGFYLQRKLSSPLHLQEFNSQYPCVFVLSTGRVGTQTLAALLELSDNLVSVHEPIPKLFGLGRLAYLYQDNNPTARDILQESLLSSREYYWKNALSLGRGYAETSPQLTFLAALLKDIQPQARFIHLVRHPYAVIRSGLRRGWYAGNPADRTRIQPRPDDSFNKQWNSLSALDKNAWLWYETNRWILSFTDNLSAEEVLLIHAEDLFAGELPVMERLFNFTSSQIPPQYKIRRILKQRLNRQRVGDFPPPQDWDGALKKRVWNWVGSIAEELGYLP